MCGICGVIDYADRQVEQQVIRAMCSQMAHRGPDDEGAYFYNGSPGVGLGHRRLSIIDLSSAGHQPMANEDKTIWLVFNGEIYNYQELRINLEQKGHKFSSNSDSETLIHLYEERAEGCLGEIRGMFAFAIWDERKKVLFAGRDRVGKKPFLYAKRNARFFFASEFPALLAAGASEKKINLESIHYYLTFGYVPAPLTIYKDIFKLPPAHFLLFKEGEVRIERYWNLDYSQKINISEEDAADEVLKLLKEATKIRLYSDVPLGAFLSGGIDSSTVVGLMSEVYGQRVKTFSIGFAEKDYNELKYASNIAKRFDTEHHEFIVQPRELEILPLLVERYGEPYADSSCIPTYYVAKQTKKYVTVALNGDGGDESFAGYDRYPAMLAAEAYQKMPKIPRAITRGLANILPDCVGPKNMLRRTKKFFAAAGLPFQERYLRWVSIFTDELKEVLYSREFKEKIADKNTLSWFAPYLNSYDKFNLLDALLSADINTYLPNDLLVKMDIVSMANSLETRSPFLDHKVMEFVARLPGHYKMKGFVKKYLLKKIIKGMVPSNNINRRKMGFGIPVGKWFRCELKDFLLENLLSEKSRNRGYFNFAVIKTLVKDHIDSRKDYTFQLWALLMLELWHRRFID